MKKSVFIVLVLVALTSCRKERALDVEYYPFCGSWSSSKHALDISENGRCIYKYGSEDKKHSIRYRIYFKGNTLSLSTGQHHNDYTILENPHTDSLSGSIKMKLSGFGFYDGEAFTKN